MTNQNHPRSNPSIQGTANKLALVGSLRFAPAVPDLKRWGP